MFIKKIYVNKKTYIKKLYIFFQNKNILHHFFCLYLNIKLFLTICIEKQANLLSKNIIWSYFKGGNTHEFNKDSSQSAWA
ncbi:conserved hypothetical protein [uncultured Desulfovibrio sp.]|uniref:Uncharacterized protein n=1 Tax=uncultured Desulfovibrio sp. TaxID=167968 RepID=A0A212IWQ6_9BACT|nr:conserved hypothetical protein [uncultured Desulfovibrio sp.]